jgi:4-amino-4-deoxy-L-arabinose transferase-like glycosyltransferase
MRNYSVIRYSVAWLCIAALLHLLIGFSIELSVDEAHYVLYAKHLAWSYFDHPPLVGWAQWPLVQLTSTAGLIRLLPECLWAVSLVLVYLNTKALRDWMEARAESNSVELPSPQVSEWLAVIGISLALLPHLLAVSLLPDTLLTTLSLGLMLLSFRWVNQQEFNGWHWLLMGVLLGLAGLSKYTAVFAALAVALVFALSDRKIPFDSVWPWTTIAIAMVLVSPVFYWNATNDWMSFQSPTTIAFVVQTSEQAVVTSPSFTGLPSFLATNFPAWIFCTQNEHFSITPLVRTVTSGFNTIRPKSS